MAASVHGAASPLAAQTLALVLAGGNGTRLGELTRWHAKPALPFAGQYRNIDFTLSNCVNSGTRRIAVLTQYKAHSLIQHIRRGWSFLPGETGEFVEIWPAQQRRGAAWYDGTADAVFQNLDLVDAQAPEHVLILAGDHIYTMNYLQMLEAHVARGAEVTVGCVEVPIADAGAFGVLEVDGSARVVRFEEKPALPRPLPRRPERALVSMGIYVFERSVLADCLGRDAADGSSQHDFGRNILPRLLAAGGDVHGYVFREPLTGSSAYWRDVGTVESYWMAHMELLVDHAAVDLYDDAWPIRTDRPQSPPPRFIGQGTAVQSIVSGGCLVSGRVEQSVLSMNCRVARDSLVESAVLLPGVEIGRGCRVTNAVVGHGCRIPDGAVVGHSPLIGVGFSGLSPVTVTLVTADDDAALRVMSAADALPRPSLVAAARGALADFPASHAGVRIG